MSSGRGGRKGLKRIEVLFLFIVVVDDGDGYDYCMRFLGDLIGVLKEIKGDLVAICDLVLKKLKLKLICILKRRQFFLF